MLNRILNRREEEKRVREEGRLPPGQSLTQKFPVLHYGATPKYKNDLSDWDFRIFGLVDEDKRWTWDQFMSLPRAKVTMDIHCVTRWSKFDTVWEGVSVKTLIDEGIVTPPSDAKYVLQHCDYGFTTNLPLDVMLQPNVLLATHFNGEPLERDHGYPLRVVVGTIPDQRDAKSAYFWKGGKWLRALQFLAEDELGFWEKAGYHNEGDPWKEQRFGRT